MKKILEIYDKHKEVINYLIFGILDTVVNLNVKYLLLFTILDEANALEIQISVIVSWIAACLFAYFTNRIIVFKSKSKEILKEVISFFTARIITLGMEMLIMFIFVTVLGLNSNLWVAIWSLIAQAVVIISNYVFSKLIIFKKKEE